MTKQQAILFLNNHGYSNVGHLPYNKLRSVVVDVQRIADMKGYTVNEAEKAWLSQKLTELAQYV